MSKSSINARDLTSGLGTKKTRRIASGFKQMRSFIICFSLFSALLMNLFAKPLLRFFVDSTMNSYSEIIQEGCAYLKTIRLIVGLILKKPGYGPASIWIAIPIGWLAGLTITSIKIYRLFKNSLRSSPSH